MAVRLYRDGEDKARWARFVEKHPGCSAYHDLRWREVVEESFGHKACYLLSENVAGDVDGILPLVHLKSRLFGNFLVSMPYFNYGGICADHQSGYEQLLREAIHLADGQGADFIEFRDVSASGGGLSTKTHKVSMRLALPPTGDELWKSFSPKLRSQIRRPEKEGMYVRIGRDEELNGFYRVFSVNMRDLGTPVYSKAFFRSILRRFPESTWICSVYYGDRPVASAFLLKFREKMEVPWASSLKRFNPYSPNMRLYWGLLEFACAQGCGVFDFGRCTPGEGPYRFKAQWGAKPVPLYWHYWLKNGVPLPELNPKNKRYQTAVNLWRRLPVGLTRLIGPVLVKNIP